MEIASTKPVAPALPVPNTPKESVAHGRRESTRKGDHGDPDGWQKAISTSSLANSADSPLMASSFAGHFGQLIISEGIAPIPRALYLYQGDLNLSPQQVWFISCVLAHKWDGDLPHPSLQEIARHATLGLRQVKKIKNSIVHADLLEVRQRYGSDGEQDANSYDFGLLFDRLESLMLADLGAPKDDLAEEALASNPDPDPGPGHLGASNIAEMSHSVSKVKERDHSFAARFGRIVLRRGVATVPTALFSYQSQLHLSPQQMWFIVYILSFQWSTELPYPSLRKMASNTGYSERQIHRIKDSLVCAGYLRVIERRGADGADTTSAYDFTELLMALNELIRKHRSGAKKQTSKLDKTGKSGEIQSRTGIVGEEDGLRVSLRSPLEAPQRGGELYVSGGVNSTSVEGEPGDSGRVNSVSEGGVNSTSVEGVNCTSYEIESIKEESDKEEPHQQHATESAEFNEAQEDRNNAYYALVDVGVIPAIAFDVANRIDPNQVLDWIRYYLSVLSKQENLSNPLGVLVSRLRSGEEPPFVPSPADLQSLRLKLSRYR